MLGRPAVAALAALLSGHALAFDADQARRYPSPDLYRPNVDSLILRGTGSQGPADGFSVTLPGGGAVTLGALAHPVTSPLLAKFRAVVATYEDYAAAGDNRPWTQSADVCPALNAAFADLAGRGGGTLALPPGIARCATPLRASNLSHVTIVGQGVGAFDRSGTELRWTGRAGALMLDLRSTAPQTPVSGVRISGLVLNGGGTARTGLYVRGLKYSTIDLLVRETTGPGVDIDVDEAKGPLVTGPLTGTVWAAFTPGSGGTDGTYTDVPLGNAGGTEGAGATADVTVSDGAVSAIAIRTGGRDYVLGDVLSLPAARIGGTTGATVTVGNCGNAATSFLDTSQNVWTLRVTQQGAASVDAQGVRIGPGSPWLDTNSSQWLNVLTLTQAGTGFEIGNADTNEFLFTRGDHIGSVGHGLELRGGLWGLPSSARANRFGTVSAAAGLVARGGPHPSTRNVVAKYNTESGEAGPVYEAGAGITITDDQGYPIGNVGFTVNQARTGYTPELTRGTSAATSATAAADYRRYGREILGIRLDMKVTGGSGYIRASLPCAPFKDTVLTGFDRATGLSVQGRIGFADPSVYIYNADGSTPGASAQPLLTGDLECAN
ncbi:hypothetical protein [Methylobacterium sp. D54C]